MITTVSDLKKIVQNLPDDAIVIIKSDEYLFTVDLEETQQFQSEYNLNNELCLVTGLDFS